MLDVTRYDWGSDSVTVWVGTSPGPNLATSGSGPVIRLSTELPDERDTGRYATGGRPEVRVCYWPDRVNTADATRKSVLVRDDTLWLLTTGAGGGHVPVEVALDRLRETRAVPDAWLDGVQVAVGAETQPAEGG